MISSEQGRELRYIRALKERQSAMRDKLTHVSWPANDPLSTRQVAFILATRPGRRPKVAYSFIRSGSLPAQKLQGRWWVRKADLADLIQRLLAVDVPQTLDPLQS